MKKTILFSLAGLSLFLAGCTQQVPTQNQNLPTQSLNSSIQNVNQNETKNTNGSQLNVNQNSNQDTNTDQNSTSGISRTNLISLLQKLEPKIKFSRGADMHSPQEPELDGQENWVGYYYNGNFDISFQFVGPENDLSLASIDILSDSENLNNSQDKIIYFSKIIDVNSQGWVSSELENTLKSLDKQVESNQIFGKNKFDYYFGPNKKAQASDVQYYTLGLIVTKGK